jgi:hypothetical protein
MFIGALLVVDSAARLYHGLVCILAIGGTETHFATTTLAHKNFCIILLLFFPDDFMHSSTKYL